MPPTGPAPPAVPPPQRNGCLTAFMVIGGVILLLPGLCALFFGIASLKEGSLGGIMPFVLVGLLVGAVVLFFQPGFMDWVVQVEEQGWFHAVQYKGNQGLRVRRGTMLLVR